MNKSLRLLLIALLFVAIGILAGWLGSRVVPTAQAQTDHKVYLPLVQTENVFTGEIANPSFENGWYDLPPAPGNLINQNPNEWGLRIYDNEPLPGDPNTVATGIPEAIHKHIDQLPPNEQPGGKDELILDGEWVYKIFHFGQPFAAVLTQSVNSAPFTEGLLTVPIQIHRHGDPDCFGAEFGTSINGGNIEWVNSCEAGDRTWHYQKRFVTMPENGVATIEIYVKSKWNLPKDFFIDNVTLEPFD